MPCCQVIAAAADPDGVVRQHLSLDDVGDGQDQSAKHRAAVSASAIRGDISPTSRQTWDDYPTITSTDSSGQVTATASSAGTVASAEPVATSSSSSISAGAYGRNKAKRASLAAPFSTISHATAVRVSNVRPFNCPPPAPAVGRPHQAVATIACHGSRAGTRPPSTSSSTSTRSPGESRSTAAAHSAKGPAAIVTASPGRRSPGAGVLTPSASGSAATKHSGSACGRESSVRSRLTPKVLLIARATARARYRARRTDSPETWARVPSRCAAHVFGSAPLAVARPEIPCAGGSPPRGAPDAAACGPRTTSSLRLSPAAPPDRPDRRRREVERLAHDAQEWRC